MIIPINYWAVLVAAVVEMVLGALWYSPVLFVKPWIKALGWTEEQVKAQMKKGAGSSYPWMFVAAVVMAYILSVFVFYAGAVTWGAGMAVAFWAWLGFVVTSSSAGVLFEKRPSAAYWIGMFYYLVSMLLMGGILAVWR